MCLLDAKARLVLGRVAQETQPALHLLEAIGFAYMNEVDPFDGGPHLNAKAKNVSIIKNSKYFKIAEAKTREYTQQGLVALCRDNQFLCGLTSYVAEGDELFIPEKSMRVLQLSPGESVCFTPTISTKIKGKKNGR